MKFPRTRGTELATAFHTEEDTMALTLPARTTLPSSGILPSLDGQPFRADNDDPSDDLEVKWSWSCRAVADRPDYRPAGRSGAPRAGDVALVRVREVGQHSRVSTVGCGKLRLYPGDLMAGVFGNRYATDAFEAEVRGTDDLHVLTDAGMIGTVLSRHSEVKRPTRLEFLHYLRDADDRPLNLKDRLFRPADPGVGPKDVLFVVGTGMNSGKTTTAAKLVKALLRRGLRVAAYKLTGSVCERDRSEFRATEAHDVRDFSDYGFPSTYRATREELVGLFGAMLNDAALARPDLVVMEVADGVLQRETRLLLEDRTVRQRVGGLVLAAPCAGSALFGVEQTTALGHPVVAVSGRITNSPLFMREFADRSPVPVATSVGDGGDLAGVVAGHFRVGS